MNRMSISPQQCDLLKAGLRSSRPLNPYRVIQPKDRNHRRSIRRALRLLEARGLVDLVYVESSPVVHYEVREDQLESMLA